MFRNVMLILLVLFLSFSNGISQAITDSNPQDTRSQIDSDLDGLLDIYEDPDNDGVNVPCGSPGSQPSITGNGCVDADNIWMPGEDWLETSKWDGDTDDDGLWDGDELFPDRFELDDIPNYNLYPSTPLDRDTDDDGVVDGYNNGGTHVFDINTGSYAANYGPYNPWDPRTFNDGAWLGDPAVKDFTCRWIFNTGRNTIEHEQNLYDNDYDYYDGQAEYLNRQFYNTHADIPGELLATIDYAFDYHSSEDLIPVWDAGQLPFVPGEWLFKAYHTATDPNNPDTDGDLFADGWIPVTNAAGILMNHDDSEENYAESELPHFYYLDDDGQEMTWNANGDPYPFGSGNRNDLAADWLLSNGAMMNYSVISSPFSVIEPPQVSFAESSFGQRYFQPPVQWGYFRITYDYGAEGAPQFLYDRYYEYVIYDDAGIVRLINPWENEENMPGGIYEGWGRDRWIITEPDSFIFHEATSYQWGNNDIDLMINPLDRDADDDEVFDWIERRGICFEEEGEPSLDMPLHPTNPGNHNSDFNWSGSGPVAPDLEEYLANNAHPLRQWDDENANIHFIDSDEDNLWRNLEFSAGTCDELEDTDGDGLTDCHEINSFIFRAPGDPTSPGSTNRINGLGSNPLLIDSDGDGLSDFDEWASGTFFGENGRVSNDEFAYPISFFRSNPQIVDSDLDGLTDDVDVNPFGSDIILPTLDPPSEVSIIASDQTVMLSWNYNQNLGFEDHFSIQYQVENSGDTWIEQIVPVVSGQTSYTEFITDLENDITYCFQIALITISGYSSEVVPDQPLYATPFDLAPGFSCHDIIDIPVSECFTLEAFYISTNGSNWSNNTNWLSGLSVVNWYGLTINDGRISTFDMPNNNLTGTLLNLNLPALTYLDVSHNDLSGPIPNLNFLQNLEQLYLNSNLLTNLPDFSHLTNLTHVRIDSLGLNFSDCENVQTLTEWENMALLVHSPQNNGFTFMEDCQFFGPFWHVSVDGSDTEGNGSEDFPFASIQYAINRVFEGSTIIVHEGTYVENINFVGKNLTVVSEFVLDNDESHIENTIIDGNQNGSVVTFENCEDERTLLCGFTITNGYVSGDNTNQGNGGGIVIFDAGPILTNLIITNNQASSAGGGLYFRNQNCEFGPQIIECVIENNFAGSLGGGIYFQNSVQHLNATVDGTLIRNNQANEGSGIHFNHCGYLINSVVEENQATSYGGGMFVTWESYINELPPKVINSTIVNNTADVKGGGICYMINGGQVVNSIVYDNLPVNYEKNDFFIDQGIDFNFSCTSPLPEGTGNVDSDPLFVDSENSDYHLTTFSPCLGAGTDTEAPDDDYDGQSRPNPADTAPDIGAFEHPCSRYFGFDIMSLTLSENENQTVNIMAGGPFSGDVEISLSHGDPNDFDPPFETETVSFDGTNSIPFTISPRTNDEFEGSEYFEFLLTPQTNEPLCADSILTVYITDWEEETTQQISTMDVVHPIKIGTRSTIEFPVTLSVLCRDTVVVDYNWNDSTAVNGTHYVASAGQIQFVPNTRSIMTQYISAEIPDGLTIDPEDETLIFSLQLSIPEASDIELIDDRAQATLVDDENSPLLAINYAEHTREDAESITFLVSLVGVQTEDVTVDYTTINGSAHATADFDSTFGTLTFTTGSRLSEQTISVPIINDDTYELDECLFVRLSNSNGAAIIVAQAIGVIRNEDYHAGDIDMDERLTDTDVELMATYIILGGNLTPDEIERADLNGDDRVDVLDINVLIDLIMTNCFD